MQTKNTGNIETMIENVGSACIFFFGFALKFALPSLYIFFGFALKFALPSLISFLAIRQVFV